MIHDVAARNSNQFAALSRVVSANGQHGTFLSTKSAAMSPYAHNLPNEAGNLRRNNFLCKLQSQSGSAREWDAGVHWLRCRRDVSIGFFFERSS